MGQTIYDRLLKESKHYDGWLYIGDDKIRYALGQPGTYNLIVIGINPSSATPEKDDPTIRRVRKTAEMNGFDGWIMLNIYPVRSAKPEDMPEKVDKQLSRYNIAVITDCLCLRIRAVTQLGKTCVQCIKDSIEHLLMRCIDQSADR